MTTYKTIFFLAISATLQAIFPEPSYESPFPLSIDYLYWKVQEEQLYPAIFAQNATAKGLNKFDIALKNQTFDYTSGFRAGIGAHIPCDRGDIKLSWTRIHPRTTAHYSVSNAQDLIILAFFDQTNSDVPHAKSVLSNWHLNYDMLDLDLSHQYSIGSCFTLRPRIGLKGGWIKQTQAMKVCGIQLGQSPIEAVVHGSVNRQNNFKGIGPLFGVDLHMAVLSQFGLFGTFNAALPLGKFDLKTESFLSDTPQASGPQLTTITNSHYFLSPTLQMLIGGDWSRCFCQKYWIRFGAAYEVQFWWNQMRSSNSIPQALFINNPAGGDLIMHGLTLQATLDF